MHQFPHISKPVKSTKPFDLVHTDLWGPSSTPSSHCFRHYIHFVDDYTRYTWIYPLTLRSEAVQTVKNFLALVKTQFHTTVKALQSDWGVNSDHYFLFLRLRVFTFNILAHTSILKMGELRGNISILQVWDSHYLLKLLFPFLFGGNLSIPQYISLTGCHLLHYLTNHLFFSCTTINLITSFFSYLVVPASLFSGLITNISSNLDHPNASFLGTTIPIEDTNVYILLVGSI